MEMTHFDKIMDRIRQSHAVGVVNRYSCVESLSVEEALMLVMELGKRKEPRFSIDESNRFAYVNIVKWVLGDRTMECLDPTTRKSVAGDMRKGLYIAGPTGSGKTFATNVIAEFIRFCGLRFDDGEAKHSLAWQDFHASTMVDNFLSCGDCYGRTDGTTFSVLPCICIQDLGTEAPESVYMGNRIQVLRKEIERRGDKGGCITLFTSNFRMGSDTIRETYGDRAFSRLSAMCNYFEMGGNDRRY